jgi:hypothetical protein
MTYFEILYSLLGSDHGKFVLFQVATYLDEAQLWFAMIVIDGRAPHSGFSPTLAPGEDPANSFELCNAAFTEVGAPNRLVYVPYFGTAACDHIAPSSIFPPTGFTNSESPDSQKTYPLNYLQHGADLLGDVHAFHNRMARELLFHSWNMAEMKGS